MTVDRIALRGLRVRGHHGVFAHERRDGQDFLVDLVLSVDTRPAAASDALADTVDYGALATDVAAVVGGEPVDLLETLAQRIADRALADPRVQAVEVTVHKPQAPIPLTFADVTVSITRAQPQAQSQPQLQATHRQPQTEDAPENASTGSTSSTSRTTGAMP
ncbi:MAG TPA: dihydroneopterin aldolase [Motilibacteraceae bacterium]|nr:dihydroneopterin aldolase [Motilibacteraceae bacterium]